MSSAPNWHGIVSGGIGAVNPFETVVLSFSKGTVVGPNGSRTPAYQIMTAQAQVQALPGGALAHVDGQNLNSVMRAVYFYGDVEAIVRFLKQGGDLITRSDGSEWLVTNVDETWSGNGWCKVVVTLQNGS